MGIQSGQGLFSAVEASNRGIEQPIFYPNFWHGICSMPADF